MLCAGGSVVEVGCMGDEIWQGTTSPQQPLHDLLESGGSSGKLLVEQSIYRVSVGPNAPLFRLVVLLCHSKLTRARHIQLESSPSVNVCLTLLNIITSAVRFQKKVFSHSPATMDPVTTIGLVSAILSFVGAAEKTLKLAWTLYNSAEGSSEETEMRLKLADSMAVIWKRIIPTNQPALTEEDRALVTLAQECNRLTNDIKEELQTLRPKRRKSKAHSGLAALRTLMVDPKIKDLEKQLQRCRDQLHFHIAALSR